MSITNVSKSTASNKVFSKDLPLPHPGIFYGAYPYKREVKTDKLEEILSKLKPSTPQHKSSKKKHWADFLKRVHQFDAELNAMTDQALDDWVIDVRKKLRTNGLTDELTVRAFATIREVAGRVMGMYHFDCQLLGGWVMLNGLIAEMQTGEGKTLTATLSASCAAMAGIPVHVITVNDYLVERDAELMRPVYERLGLTVGCVTGDKEVDERREAYRCDITYCTSQHLTFDYLRDRMLLKNIRSDLDLKLESLYSNNPVKDQLLLRGLNFAIVDEADSVFIDEARTPLILSKKGDDTLREEIHCEAILLARQLKKKKHFILDDKIKYSELTELGKAFLEDLTSTMQGLWRGSRVRTALVEQALVALYLYRRDEHYHVNDGAICIIDENTGRSMPDRSWEAGLHQMIEEKEGCEQSGQNETLARISYQRFFRRYLRLSGMTGTAKEVVKELKSVYELDVVTIPTNNPVLRKIQPDDIYKDADSRWQAVLKNVQFEHANGRPILVGTRTVKDSEHLSDILKEAGLSHQVLNAKQDSDEAEIVAHAGDNGQITIATNMAGRGTDIKLTDEALEAGGLHVICCERNISARIDRQLAGRCGRQGNPGSYQPILSLQDALIEERVDVLAGILRRMSMKGSVVRPAWIAKLLMKAAQGMSERYYHQIRKSMMKVDERRESMLAFSGKSE